MCVFDQLLTEEAGHLPVI
jgi:hypothetical protein